MQDISSVGDKLLQEAQIYFEDIENIVKAIASLKENKEEFDVRISEFESVCNELNSLFSANLDEAYRDVRLLGASLGGKKLLTLTQLVSNETNQDKNLIQFLLRTFEQIHSYITKGTWQFPTTITNNPGQLLSAMLIEGYGVFLENYIHSENISRIFVLAFEEVLVMRYPQSKMHADVIEWIKEEKEDFPKDIQEKVS